MDAASLCAFFVQRWIRIGIHTSLDLFDFRVTETSGGADDTERQLEECGRRGLSSRVAMGEARNELRLLAPQILRKMDQTLRNDDGLAFRCVSSDETSPAIFLSKAKEQLAFGEMRDLSGSRMTVGLVDGARPNCHQVLSGAIARQSGQSGVEVHEHGPQVAERRHFRGLLELEDEIVAVECLPLRQLRDEVQVVHVDCTQSAMEAETAHDHANKQQCH